jgi:hypothetical protein
MGSRRRATGARLLVALLVAVAVLVALGAPVGGAQTPAAPRPRVAYEVDGRQTRMAAVIVDLVALARNKALRTSSIDDEGDRVPVREVVASWVTRLIQDEVVAIELERRGVEATARQRLLASRLDEKSFGKEVWGAFPAGFRSRQTARTARSLALARSEGIDLQQRSAARREFAGIVTELARAATVTVAPRFGSWEPQLAVVVAKTASGDPSGSL